MRWLPFFILAYVALGLQAGLSGFVEVSRAQPNLVLIVVVFIAANATRDLGLLACILLGAIQDLLGVGPWGVGAFTYGLVALAVISTKEFVYGDHFLTHFTLVLFGGWIEAIVRLIHGWVYRSLHTGPKWGPPGAMSLFLGAIYTAVLGVPIIYLLQRMRRSFGFRAAAEWYKDGNLGVVVKSVSSGATGRGTPRPVPTPPAKKHRSVSTPTCGTQP